MNNKTRKKNGLEPNISDLTLNNIYAMNLTSSKFNTIKFMKYKNNTNTNYNNSDTDQVNTSIVHIESDPYKFIMYQDEDIMNYILYFMSTNPRIKEPCLKIYIPKKNDVEGLIEKLNHEKSCSIEKELDEREGTIHMLKTALKYIIDNYPHTKYFRLTDMTFKKIPGLDSSDLPWITARRLLQGSKGWYEEHFQAKPTRKTKQLIDIIKRNRQNIDSLIASNVNNSLWNSEKIIKIANKIDGKILGKNILSTDWIIDNNTIKGYNIDYKISATNNINEYSNVVNVLNNAYTYNVGNK